MSFIPGVLSKAQMEFFDAPAESLSVSECLCHDQDLQ